MIIECMLLGMIVPFVLVVLWLYDIRTYADMVVVIAFVAGMVALYAFMVVVSNG